MDEESARSGIEETPVKRITADEEYELEVNGFRCPDQYVTFFTPLEFEELVTMFQEYDANGNGTLDIYEIRKILFHMDMEMTKENAQELMDVIDTDGSGEIDFDEYCSFIALTKQGDEKFTKFNKLLDKMGDTPLGVLEQQAKARHFTTRFFLVEEREATATTPPLVVIELLIEGLWHNRENGITTSRFETKRFQGMGPDSRHAKDAATKLALVKLRNYMPGATFPEGEFPDEWLKWVNDNICRGVPPLEIIDVLVQKGFKPTKNTPLMHKLTASALFDDFQHKYPDFDPDDMSKSALDMRFSNWIKRVGDTGIDGTILLQTLEDRGMEISKHQPFIADKMRYNEFSSLMDKDGKAPKFLDFWQACADGFDQAVELYIRGDMEVNMERMGRFGSISRTALMLASMGNHAKTVDLLIKGQANVKVADRRGRTALHYAALHGALECCDLLMNAGAALFLGDHQGNTALHLATWQNHPQTVDFLCYKGQEFTRSITADKLPARNGSTFNQLAAEIFMELQELKLRPVETRRFQKIWMHDAACLFREKMDSKVRHMLAPTCVEIMEDVLHRFDPRPETGIFVSTATEGEQLFIPTIPSPQELAVLLRYMFRQSALDCTNNWNRTAMHLAADENCVASHRETISLLADKHGCNVMLKDMHDRTPYHLLVMDKVSPKNPTATSVREYLLFDTRVAKITELTDQFDREDRVVLEKRRQEVLDECIRRAYDMNHDLWEATRMASLLVRVHDKKWNFYVDPDTKNGFYCLQPLDSTMGDPFTNWSFGIPDAVRATVHRDIGWEYHRQTKSEVIRTIGDWVTLQCSKIGVYYYYNVETMEYTFTTPPCYDWKALSKEAKYIESYGYSEEWQEFVVDQNFFYFERNRKLYRWTKPREAVTVTPAEKFCTGYKKKNRRIDQKWYTCDQCNKELKERSGDQSEKLTMIKICEPCVNRCHRGHKGTRLVRISPISCQCSSLCHEFCPCRALEVSQYQLNVMGEAAEFRQEERRQRMHNALMPPVFAYCPEKDRDGNVKRESGYTMCRRRPPLNVYDLGEKVLEFGDSTVVSDEDDLSTRLDSSSYLDDDEYSVVGSLYEGDSGRISRTFLQLAESNFELLVRDEFKEYARQGWMEVLDPEVVDEVEIGARVLCRRQGVVPRCYGTVRQKMRRGVYRVQFTKEGDMENISTENLEVISRQVFYFNSRTGISAWELPPLVEANGGEVDVALPQTQELAISGNEWISLRLVAAERRSFKHYEEFEDPFSKIIFWVHHDTYAEEMAVLKIQNFYRYRRRKAKPRNWTSTAFTFTKPQEVFEEERVKAGWALLRRRANCLGEFMDVDYFEWEELMDQESADFFYWQEDMDAYSWDKPPVPKTVYATKIKPLEVGEKVTHKFPGCNGEEICTVTRVRKDDQTNEDMYDLQHDRKETLKVKWVPRYRIKKLAKSGEELILALSAAQWKKQIRRQREKEKRQRAQARKKRAEEEKARRGKTVVSKSSNTTSMSLASTADEVERARSLRARAEKLQLKEERDAVMLAKKEVAMAALMKEMEEMNKKLSKSELISLQRSISLKLEVEALMEKRTKSQNVLLAKRTQAKHRMRLLESALRVQEDLMTTPRSSVRRRLLRQMHFAILRQLRGQVICEWGCGDWVKLGQEQQDHQLNFCSRRIVSCALGCSKRLTEDEWLEPYQPDRDVEAEENEMALGEDLPHPPEGDGNAPPLPPMTFQEHHETAGCPKRLQPCPRQCLEWVTAEELEFHMNELCVKRDAQPLECRQGCGMMFGGIVETMIQAEDERFEHEQEECPFRQVRCNWRNLDGSFCAAQMCATERDAHRDAHIEKLGISTYLVPGTYVYKVHANCYKLKIQMWGAGGGSGHFKERRGGSGGGGAFVEIFINVNPFDILEIVVGRGGQAGVYGTELEAVHTTARENDDEGGTGKLVQTFDVIDASYGVALGGLPGGGDGSGGGGRWAAGGGGGYTIVSKRTREGSQVIAVAGGGGGGGSQDGVPGCGMEGPYSGTRIDIRNGGCGIGDKGGVAGDAGNQHTAEFAATSGDMWQGGNGSQYGGGGGGGYAGGGGGGTSPGIGGGGGGGSSFIYLPICRDYLIVHGNGKLPGGMEHDPPGGVGVGEWDKVGGVCGEGGTGHPTELNPGNGGAVRILKPGFFQGGEADGD